MVEVNSPYPATAYLTGFLRSVGVPASQADLSIELACALLTRSWLKHLREHAVCKSEEEGQAHPAVDFFLEAFPAYHRTVEPILGFLQGSDTALAHRLVRRTFCPEGPSFAKLEARPDLLTRGFGNLGLQDQAKYLAGLYLDDIVTVINEVVDGGFRLQSYGAELAASITSFDPIAKRLAAPRNPIDESLDLLLVSRLRREQPSLVGITIPFRGNLYGALRCAEITKQTLPGCPVVLGGGYVNTDLRDLQDPGIFKYVDFITLDDGERPLLCLIEHLTGKRKLSHLLPNLLLSGRSGGICLNCFRARHPTEAYRPPNLRGASHR